MSSCARSWRDKPPQEVPNMLWETWESSFFLQSWLGDAGQGKARRMASCWLLCEVVDINKAHARALLTSRSLESRLPDLAKIFTSSCLQMCCLNFYKTVGARMRDALQALVPGVKGTPFAPGIRRAIVDTWSRAGGKALSDALPSRDIELAASSAFVHETEENKEKSFITELKSDAETQTAKMLEALIKSQKIPANLNLFFLDLSATTAIPNCSASAFSCEIEVFEINSPLADSRALDKQT